MENTNKLVADITDYVNTFGDKSIEFNQAMSREHRTLQASFTKLCLSWLEHCASDEYYTDGRNEQCKEISQKLLDGFKKHVEESGYTGATLDMMSKPSGWLRCI